MHIPGDLCDSAHADVNDLPGQRRLWLPPLTRRGERLGAIWVRARKSAAMDER